MSTHRSSSLFTHVSSDPDPDANPTIWEYRLSQTRPFSTNPFEIEPTSSRGDYYGVDTYDSPPSSPISKRSSSKYEDSRLGYSISDEKNVAKSTMSTRKNFDREWGDQVPSWLNLFYDLAWTATFASLTSNAKFGGPWDSVSYIAFFATAWWLWVSQIFYNVDFYTNDWFHMFFIFLQLLIFGGLAATTRGKYFDITNYILHSPGSDDLEPYDIEKISPERYAEERLTKISVRVIMIAISVSRILLLIQHLRVAIYAKITNKTARFPFKLLLVPAALTVSAILFFISFRVSMTDYGLTPQGSKLKFILGGVALLVEIIAHLVRFQMEIGADSGDGVKLKSHASITGRLNDITTIIVGEGINSIAGTFYAIQKAPGFGSPTAIGIVCCALIVFFLVYLYFNGAAPLKSVRRRAAWVMMHLPWLLSVILLLEGVKNQLLLQSFLSSADYMQTSLFDVMHADIPDDQVNATVRPILLKGGMVFDDEFSSYADMLTSNYSATPNAVNMTEQEKNTVIDETIGVWYVRMQMKGTLNTYITFMENDSIPDTTQQNIQRYLNDYNYTVEDYYTASFDGDTPRFYEILGDLVESSVNSIRYIMAMCGATFITLASLNLIQSWPRDRFHWASIFSRYAMGICMLLLLLLNIGKTQSYFQNGNAADRAGYLKWLDSGWVLPTLALAYATQFVTDTVLFYLGVRSSKKSTRAVSQGEKERKASD